MTHFYDRVDSRGTLGHDPGWILYFTLAPQEMGRQAGTKGAFVAPVSRDYACSRLTTPTRASLAADAWLDDLEKTCGTRVRGDIKAWVAGGLDEGKLKSYLRSTVDQQLVYERLKTASKEIYQQRVVIDDYNSIPVAINQPYNKGNSLPKNKLLAKYFLSDDERSKLTKAGVFGANYEELDLPYYRTETFTKEANLIKITPGETLYRVTDPGGDGGP